MEETKSAPSRIPQGGSGKAFSFVKMKFAKYILKCAAMLISALLLIVIALYLAAGPLSKVAIQSFTPLVTGVSCRVDSVSLHPFSAKVRLKNLVCGNAGGYTSEYSVALGEVTLVLKLSTLFSKKIVIEEIHLKDVSINYETNSLFTSSNVLDIIRRLDQAVQDEHRIRNEAKTAKDDRAAAGNLLQMRRFQLNKMTFQHITLRIALKGSGRKIPLHVTLPETEPLGAAGEGLTAIELLDAAASGIYTKVFDFAMASQTEIIKKAFDAVF